MQSLQPSTQVQPARRPVFSRNPLLGAGSLDQAGLSSRNQKVGLPILIFLFSSNTLYRYAEPFTAPILRPISPAVKRGPSVGYVNSHEHSPKLARTGPFTSGRQIVVY